MSHLAEGDLVPFPSEGITAAGLIAQPTAFSLQGLRGLGGRPGQALGAEWLRRCPSGRGHTPHPVQSRHLEGSPAWLFPHQRRISRSDNAVYTGMSLWEQPRSWQMALSRVKGGSQQVWCPNPLIVRLSFRFLGLNGCNEEVKDYANIKETSSRGSPQQKRGREPSGRNCARTVGVSVSHKQGALVILSQGLKIFAVLVIFHCLIETPALSSKEVAPCRGCCARSQRPSQCTTGWRLLGQHSCLRQRSPAPIYYNSGGPHLKGVATDLNRDVRTALKRLAGADTT